MVDQRREPRQGRSSSTGIQEIAARGTVFRSWAGRLSCRATILLSVHIRTRLVLHGPAQQAGKTGIEAHSLEIGIA